MKGWGSRKQRTSICQDEQGRKKRSTEVVESNLIRKRIRSRKIETLALHHDVASPTGCSSYFDEIKEFKQNALHGSRNRV
jgi:hypothetical protein